MHQLHINEISGNMLFFYLILSLVIQVNQEKDMELPFKKIRSKVLDSQSKNIIYHVNKYFLEEKANGGPVIGLNKASLRTSKATNVSLRTVHSICAAPNKARRTQLDFQDPEFFSPKKKKFPRPVTDFSNFDKCLIRKTVLGFYERKEIPTLGKIKEKLKENMSYSGSIESLRRVLLQVGFKYSKVGDYRLYMERNEVIATRSRFLREMRQLTQSHQNFVFVGEIWLDLNYTDTKGAVVKPAAGKGSRLIVLHAGTKEGFVVNCSLVFQCKNDKDFQKQITTEMFEDWFKNQLMSNIAQNSVIIMDNAPYHCRLLEKEPIISCQKSEICEWLVQKGVNISDNLLKAELLECVKNVTSSEKNYVVDRIASKAGHRVVRLPLFHCQYNALEFVWTQVKAYVAKKHVFDITKLTSRLYKALNKVTPQNWADAVTRADLERETDSMTDIAVENFFESFINNATESSDS